MIQPNIMSLKELEEQSNQELKRMQNDLKSWLDMYQKAYPDLHITIIDMALILESHEINSFLYTKLAIERMENNIKTMQSLLDEYKNDAERIIKMKYATKGEWDTEPDQCTWIDSETGYVCEALRNKDQGYWRGYVRLPQDHVVSLNYEKILDVEMLDFNFEDIDYCGMYDKEHVWMGFACDSFNDIRPSDSLASGRYNEGAIYKNLKYVRDKCAFLAKQLKDVNFEWYFKLRKELADELTKVNKHLQQIAKRKGDTE